MNRVVLVTDPMCSWCWGMATEFERAREALSGRFEFDLMLGGINPHGTQPIGDYGRRFLMKLWKEVEATTGAPFGYRFPEEYVHNSVLPCLVLEAVRAELNKAPFEMLHELQRRFFVEGRNINDLAELLSVVEHFGVGTEKVETAITDPGLKERLLFQFDSANSFGTNAMPSLLVGTGPELRLLAGGYVDAPMLTTLLSADQAE